PNGSAPAAARITRRVGDRQSCLSGQAGLPVLHNANASGMAIKRFVGLTQTETAKHAPAAAKWRTGDLACPDRQDCLSSTSASTIAASVHAVATTSLIGWAAIKRNTGHTARIAAPAA